MCFFPLQWTAFSTPELLNFLKILDIEERDMKKAIIFKYKLLKYRISKLLSAHKKEADWLFETAIDFSEGFNVCFNVHITVLFLNKQNPNFQLLRSSMNICTSRCD